MRSELGCTPWYIPSTNHSRVCNPWEGIEIMHRLRTNSKQKGGCKDCLPDCKEIKTSVTTSAAKIRYHRVMKRSFYCFPFRLCDTQNLNLSPLGNMSQLSSPAKWSPDVVGLYDEIPYYVRSIPSPIRQRQAGDLLTRIIEVHIGSYPY